MEVMQLADLDLNKTYSYADYLKWTFEERLELIKGKIFEIIPAPASKHQMISMVLSGELYIFFKGKNCKAYAAPFDVRLPRKRDDGDKEIFTVVQPDVCVICDLSKLDKRGCIGAPDIVVEILSPGNNQTELRNKYEVYEESGVLEYWIISPQDKTFLKYTLVNGIYQASRPLVVGDTITTVILPGFELKLETVFAGV
ncbi:Uma2 family endonuclease [Mucilaginibacter glaciei]|uniref:Uma2 family endonuclease n=1 Tax=Mucilaginibacter glaciei TaxID=2772109 RepID=A0A926NYM5_9SPHI|nr:Uma2 family endonuclease [Mucilaginibacter glaciei]MBD1394069.1 Uma2 family endonuclease [Mucilaginibacter glaciei]